MKIVKLTPHAIGVWLIRPAIFIRICRETHSFAVTFESFCEFYGRKEKKAQPISPSDILSAATQSNLHCFQGTFDEEISMKKILPFLLCGMLGTFGLQAQKTNNQQTHIYQIFKTSETIKIDGVLDDPVWQSTAKVGKFWYSFPVDDREVEAEYQTEVMLTYDDKFIYVAAICHGPNPYIIPSLKRDNNDFWDGDVFSLVFDAVNERTNAASFATNPAGVQFDVLIGANTGTRGGGGSGGFNRAWDNKWLVNSKAYTDHWTTEMAIPFKTLKYGNKKIWGMNFVRGVSKTNTWHTWAPVPVQLTGVDLGFTGALHWDKVPPKAKGNISVIPYMLGSTYRDFEEGEPTDNNFQVGGDAKIAINSNLNLDLTVNPDFSQVDVDEQVTNLTTVNVRFPERRLFFLENSDIFSEFGIPPMRPFFSRKIGLDEDGNSIPIMFGARLTGNMNKDLRVGLMNLQTKEEDDVPGQNYTAAAFNQRVFGRTVAKGYFLNRQAYVGDAFSKTDYNRAMGGEIDYRSMDGTFRANAGYGASLSDGLNSDNKIYHLIFSFNNRNIAFYTNWMAIGDNYVDDMGFMTWLYHYDAVEDTDHRIGYGHSFTRFSYSIYPKNSSINSHRFSFRNVFDVASERKDFFKNVFTVGYNLNFANTSAIEFEVSNQYGELFYPFDFTDETPLPADEYNWAFVGASYSSDRRKPFYYEAGFEWGGFYNGDRRQVSFELNYRQQPWGNFGVRFVRNDLEFPKPFGEESLTLIGPKMEVNFSRNLFWTTFLQYNTQSDNFNVNSRVQWQFQPLSNLFIVYTDNYFIEEWGQKNRGLVVKLNYWLNL